MKEITLFGETNFRNERKKFGIKIDDRRRHMYVIGKTGMGKTTLLENMVIEDIRAGKGVGIVDPHGEFAEKILDYIPEERMEDVIYFNPSDVAHPIAFNPLEQVDPEFRHLVASGIMGVFKKIWPDVWSARMEYILNNALLSLLEYPGATILGIMRILAEKNYRAKVVENLKDPVIKSFWVNEFARYSERFETEATAAIQNKIGQLISNPLIRNILGQTNSTIDMRDVMDKQKILIVNLSKGKMGESNSALLGSMIITKLQLAAMSRVDIPEKDRKDFYLYVDEFQNFATDSFANILSEARKYRLCLILAHQYIGQLVHDSNTKVRDAIFGNVGTMLLFRVGAEDAEFLEKEFLPEFEANDLINLTKYNIYVKLMIDGVSSRPFSAQTLMPFERLEHSQREFIIENTRDRYATTRAKVEEKIAGEWLATGESMDDKNKRRDERSLKKTLVPKPGNRNEPQSQSQPQKQEREQQGLQPQPPRQDRPREQRKEFPKAKVNIDDLRSSLAKALQNKGKEDEKKAE
ncbi:MAG: type IV secretion system DNA-binding domain-containing protein [Patescibacteria group bacterium]